MPEFFNTTNEPVVYNSDGQIAGGAEWFKSTMNPIIERALEDGVLITKEVKADSGQTKSDSKDPGSK